MAPVDALPSNRCGPILGPRVQTAAANPFTSVTENGLADLRGLGPMQRARTIIDRCAHPSYRDYLHRYVAESRNGHIRHSLEKCFELHLNLMKYGTMQP